MTDRLSPAAFGRQKGISRQAIMLAIEQGALPTSANFVRGRWLINAPEAWREWAANRPGLERAPRTRRRHAPASALVPAWPLLVEVVAQVEEGARTCFREVADGAPDLSAGAWPALCGTLALLPRALELVQAQIVAAANGGRR